MLFAVCVVFLDICCLQFVLPTWYRPFVLYIIKKFRVAFKHACI